MADGAQVTLEDKYGLAPGRAVLNGREAIVRLLLVQRAADEAAGLRTAGFVSGYHGSPLGTRRATLASAWSTEVRGFGVVKEAAARELLARLR
ncbi:MAG TPA: hypothetical protein VGD42_16865 [Lysobacter sp.]